MARIWLQVVVVGGVHNLAVVVVVIVIIIVVVVGRVELDSFFAFFWVGFGVSALHSSVLGA